MCHINVTVYIYDDILWIKTLNSILQKMFNEKKSTQILHETLWNRIRHVACMMLSHNHDISKWHTGILVWQCAFQITRSYQTDKDCTKYYAWASFLYKLRPHTVKILPQTSLCSSEIEHVWLAIQCCQVLFLFLDPFHKENTK